MKIKKCPFCGSYNVWVQEGWFGDDGEDAAWVRCGGCTACGPITSTTEEAVKKWNAAARRDEDETD